MLSLNDKTFETIENLKFQIFFNKQSIFLFITFQIHTFIYFCIYVYIFLVSSFNLQFFHRLVSCLSVNCFTVAFLQI